MLLVSGSTKTVASLAHQHRARLGHLLTPSNRNSVDSLLRTGLSWAADNGAFSGFDTARFRRLLSRVAGKPRCLFVVCPDVVGDAQRTLDLFDLWRYEVAASGQPVALVGQDGLEDLSVPWHAFDCLFIGGSTAWKLSRTAADLCHEAKARGKWIHVGRVNSLRRMMSAKDMGADSIDGSSLSMFGDKYIHRFCQWSLYLEQQGVLWTA
jgi:hypothetical protein